MEPSVRDTLRQLIVRYGHALCDDPRRCEAMLRDLCGQHKREVFILVSDLRQRVAADLLGGGGGLPTPLLLGRLRKRLEDELGLSGEAARWAVETWALALGVIAGPVPLTATDAAPPRAGIPAKSATVIRPTHIPSNRFRDRLTDGGEGPEMVRLPPGRFLMGAPPGGYGVGDDSERPQHEVRIARPFAIGRFPVTFEDYDRFVAATNRYPPHDLWGRGRRPVNVSWHDAVAYCVWLSAQTGRPYRLPSEAEWEYAGRAGTATRWPCGDDPQALDDYAWFGDNADGRTHPVGEKYPNPWGLHDIQGNVWEWVQDVWHKDYAGAPTDGSAWGALSGSARRVMRGSAFGASNARDLRMSIRHGFDPDSCQSHLGLRIAQDL